MGREVRMVPPNWEHPTRKKYDYQLRTEVERFHPMYDQNIDEQLAAWLAEFDAHRENFPSDELQYYPRGLVDWLVDNRPPDPAYYHAYTKDEATWFQLYETVSEGTPVSPPFATKEELVEYLVIKGDFWSQERAKETPRYAGDLNGRPPQWSREAAEQMVAREWAPSAMLFIPEGDGPGTLYTPETGFPGASHA